MSEFSNEVTNEDRIEVHKLCQKQLSGKWLEVNENQLIIKRFMKGYINKIFYCELPFCENKIKQVVVKLSKISEEIDPIVSMINNLVLSQKNIAPKVLKVFSGGMISKFIESRSFTRDDDFDYAIVSLLARKLAKFHSLTLPIPKDDSKKFLNTVCDIWFDNDLKQSYTCGKLHEEIQSQNKETLLNLDVLTELQWVRDSVLSFNSPIVFSHCDFNRNNILISHKPIDNYLDIFLVDFDYSCYNYRGVDIGRYFSSWGQKDPLFGNEDFPTDEQMSVFIDVYIEESIKLCGKSYPKLEINSKANIIKEAKLFTLISYLIDIIFCLWMVRSDGSKTEEFLEKGETRYHAYYVLKKKFQDEKSVPINRNH